jgi:PKD domain
MRVERDGGGGNRTPNSALQRPRVPVSTTPPRPRILGVAVAVVVAALSTAAPAGAVTYCVSNAGMGPSNCPLGADTTKTFAQAITAAQASTTLADTILLAPGTYTNQGGHDFDFDSGNGGAPNASNGLTIQGAGPALTTIAQSAGHASSNVITFSQTTATADQQVSDLTISMPPGFSGSGIFDPTGVHDVNFIAQGAMSGIALRLSNRGTYDDMNIALPLTGGASALSQPNVSVTIADSTITADHTTSNFNASEDVFRNLRIHAGTSGLVMNLSNSGVSNAATIDNVQLKIDNGGTAIGATATTGPARLNVTNTTVFGSTDQSGTGISAATTGGNPATVNVDNSIVADFQYVFSATPNAGTATVNVGHSVMYANGFFVGGAGATVNVDPTVKIGPPLLVASGGLLYPSYRSPAIDIGDPAKTNLQTDLAGQPRPIDGNGDGDALPDAGAIEYQHRPPVVTAAAAPPFAPGSPIAFTGTATDPDPGDGVTSQWSFSDNSTNTALSSSHTFSAPGPFTATLTATDSSGLTGQAQVTGTIASASAKPPADKTKPVIKSVRFDPATFRASPKADTATAAAAKPKRPPISSKLRVTLSEAASAAVVIDAKRAGRLTKAHGKTSCKPRSAANAKAKAKACTYYSTRAKLKRAHLAHGANAITFTGRFAGHALAPGAYRAMVTPTDPAGNVGAAVSAAFTISR